MKRIFKNASVVSIVDGNITLKCDNKLIHHSNVSLVSINDKTVVLECQDFKKGDLIAVSSATNKFKKGDLVKIVGKETHYHIFNYMAGLYFYTFGGLNNNTLKLNMSNSLDYNRDYTIIPTTKEEQEYFDKICKEKGYIFNKKKFSWEEYKWKPQKGDKFYMVTSFGKTDIYIYNKDNEFQRAVVEIGNCFRTKEEAEKKAKEYLKFMSE